MRTYADITGIPIEVVMTPKEMPEALQRLADREVILVDTAGRNAKIHCMFRSWLLFSHRCRHRKSSWC